MALWRMFVSFEETLYAEGRVCVFVECLYVRKFFFVGYMCMWEKCLCVGGDHVGFFF